MDRAEMGAESAELQQNCPLHPLKALIPQNQNTFIQKTIANGRNQQQLHHAELPRDSPRSLLACGQLSSTLSIMFQ